MVACGAQIMNITVYCCVAVANCIIKGSQLFSVVEDI